MTNSREAGINPFEFNKGPERSALKILGGRKGEAHQGVILPGLSSVRSAIFMLSTIPYKPRISEGKNTHYAREFAREAVYTLAESGTAYDHLPSRGPSGTNFEGVGFQIKPLEKDGYLLQAYQERSSDGANPNRNIETVLANRLEAPRGTIGMVATFAFERTGGEFQLDLDAIAGKLRESGIYENLQGEPLAGADLESKLLGPKMDKIPGEPRNNFVSLGRTVEGIDVEFLVGGGERFLWNYARDGRRRWIGRRGPDRWSASDAVLTGPLMQNKSGIFLNPTFAIITTVPENSHQPGYALSDNISLVTDLPTKKSMAKIRDKAFDAFSKAA